MRLLAIMADDGGGSGGRARFERHAAEGHGFEFFGCAEGIDQQGHGPEGAGAGEKGERGDPQNLKIAEEGLIFQIQQDEAALPGTDDLQIIHESKSGSALLKRRRISPSSANTMDARSVMPGRAASMRDSSAVYRFDVGADLGPGADQAHVSGEDVPELRQFV